jgi:hypothetical protein
MMLFLSIYPKEQGKLQMLSSVLNMICSPQSCVGHWVSSWGLDDGISNWRHWRPFLSLLLIAMIWAAPWYIPTIMMFCQRAQGQRAAHNALKLWAEISIYSFVFPQISWSQQAGRVTKTCYKNKIIKTL